jgi:hypothetical protein
VKPCGFISSLVTLFVSVGSPAAEIEHLKLQIAKLWRMQFGRKSEKLDHLIEQLELRLEDLQADDAEMVFGAGSFRSKNNGPAAPVVLIANRTSPTPPLPSINRAKSL